MDRTQAEVRVYLASVIDQRRAAPGKDIVSQFITAAMPNGEPIDDEMILQFMTLLFFGGLSTVKASMCFIIRYLAEHPGHRRQLAEHPELVPGAVEEMMRHNGIVNTVRHLKSDTVMGGVDLKKGDQIMIPMILMGLDDRVEPDALDMISPARTSAMRCSGRGRIAARDRSSRGTNWSASSKSGWREYPTSGSSRVGRRVPMAAPRWAFTNCRSCGRRVEARTEWMGRA
jgi:hypothetical protein